MDQIIKIMMMYELNGLNDIALDIGQRFTDVLGSRIEVAQAVHLLAKSGCRQIAPVPDVSARTGAEVARLQEVSALQQHPSDRTQEVSTLQQQLSDTAERISTAEQLVDAMRRSNSWRLTAPLRKTKVLAGQVWASSARE